VSLPCNAIAVVVVDDDASFRSALAAILEDDGHVVGEYGDLKDVPPAAMRAAQVVVIDYPMMASDGLSFADSVHAAQPQTAIVLATAYWTVEIEAEVAARDFIQLCRKPIDYDELHALVHQLAAGR